MTPCTGAWCNRREQCPHYSAPNPTGIDQRLCVKGADGVMKRQFAPVVWQVRRVQ